MSLEFAPLLNQLKNLNGSHTVGVDYGSESLKLVEFANASVPLKPKNFSLVTMGTGAQENILQVMREHRLAKRNVSICIADEKVESHEFQFPKLGKAELKTALEFEMAKNIPSREFVYYDLLTNHKDTGSDVSCVLAPKDLVDQRYDEVVGFGLKPYSLEPESSALLTTVHLFRPEAKELNVAILDLGYSAFRIIFVHAGRVSFTRSLYLGLGSICSQVGTAQSLPVPEVARLVRGLKRQDPIEKPGSPAEASLERLFQESLYTLCEEFTRSEFFTKDQKKLPQVEDVFLCGGGACLPMVAEYVTRHLSDKKVEPLDVFKLVEGVHDGVDPASGPLWAIALGLSIRGGP